MNETTPFDVTGVGANSVDYVAVVPALPQPSAAISKVRMDRYTVTCGGQMATALATCARFGLRTRYIGATGNDANGRLVRDALGRLDVDLGHLVVHDASNQFAIILVDKLTGERLIFWNRDERLNLEGHELPLERLAASRLVHVDDTDESAAIAIARHARANGIPVTSDIDRVTDRTPELIGAVTVAIFAENVPIQMAGGRGDRVVSREQVVAALRTFPRRAGQVFCATLGSRGAVAVDNDGVHEQPAFDVTVTDTTGAGDVFRGAFIYGRLRGWTLDEQLRFANAAAAVSCTRLGALASVPTLEEVEKLMTRRP